MTSGLDHTNRTMYLHFKVGKEMESVGYTSTHETHWMSVLCFEMFFWFFFSISIVRSTTYMQNLVVMDTTKGPVNCLFFDHFAVGDRNVQCVAREGGYSLIVEIQDLIPRETQ
jgi:hypothetical protein